MSQRWSHAPAGLMEIQVFDYCARSRGWYLLVQERVSGGPGRSNPCGFLKEACFQVMPVAGSQELSSEPPTPGGSLLYLRQGPFKCPFFAS